MIECIEWISKIAPIGTLIVAFIALLNLREIKRSNRLKSTKDELELMANLDKTWDIYNSAMMNSDSSEESMGKVRLAEERYFNLLDNICLCINKGHIEEKIFSIQYQDILFMLEEDYPTQIEKYKNVRYYPANGTNKFFKKSHFPYVNMKEMLSCIDN